MNLVQKRPVADFEKKNIFDYPGKRNDASFITDGEYVMDLPSDTSRAIKTIETYLAEHELPGLADRIPVVAYGANVSPGPMSTKFNKYPVESMNGISSAELQTVPSLYGEMHGSDVVWHGRPGQAGGYFSEIYSGPETTDVDLQVAVTFLTPEQLAIMHTTEGATYNVTVTDVALDSEHTIKAVMYSAGDASILLDDEQRPIAVEGVKRKGASYEVLDARQASAYTLASKSVSLALGGLLSSDDYTAETSALKLSEKKAKQKLVQDALVEDGKSRPMRNALSDTENYGRANFVSLPRGVEGNLAEPNRIELMEQSLSRLRQTDPNGNYILTDGEDAIKKLRIQATKELTDPRRAEALAKKLPNVSVSR